MEQKYIVRVTEHKTREVVVSAKDAEEAKRLGTEALGVRVPEDKTRAVA